MLRITLLGTAALMPLPERALTAVTLNCAGRAILFDCGEGTQTAARHAGVSLMKADLIALTHYHGDHIFGLPGLLQTLSVLGRAEPLYITGPGDLARELAPVAALCGRLNFELRLLDLPEEGVELRALHPAWPAGARLSPFPTQHRVPSQGYCFTLPRAGRFQPERARALGVPLVLWKKLQRGETVRVDGREVTPEMVLGAPRRGLQFAFTGDSAPCEAIVQAARGADLLISEATYALDEHAASANERGHMTFAQAARLARDAGVRRLWLTHFSQILETPADHLPLARAFFPEVVCGEDGMAIELDFDAE